jgi:hypothetical protein
MLTKHRPTTGTVIAMTTRSARITGPVPYLGTDGNEGHVPLGPCLVERVDNRSIEVIWGSIGQSSVAFSPAALKSARDQGNLVLLD